jgi:hypothetical protein
MDLNCDQQLLESSLAQRSVSEVEAEGLRILDSDSLLAAGDCSFAIREIGEVGTVDMWLGEAGNVGVNTRLRGNRVHPRPASPQPANQDCGHQHRVF